MKRFFFKTLLSLFCVGALAWGCGGLWFAWNVAQGRAEALQEKTGAIVVLTGGGGRIATGLRLLAAGTSEELFISGVDPRVNIGAIRAMWRGPEALPECCISLGHEAGTTEGNALEVRKWAEGKGFSSIRLVTADYHMPRALLLLRHALPALRVLPYPVRPPEIEPWSASFWALVLGEYNKTLAVRLRLSLFPDTPLESLLKR